MFLHPGSSATTVRALLDILNNNNKPSEDSSSPQSDTKDPAALKAAAQKLKTEEDLRKKTQIVQ